MPHQILPTDTFDTLEDEILFTTAAVAADPDASDLAPLTAGWLGEVDAARAQDRHVRQTVAGADASRIVANHRLDSACVAFGDDLLPAVHKDRTAARWTQFFPVAVNIFVKQALEKQVNSVLGWLGLAAGGDAVLDTHRPALAQWATASQAAIVQTRIVGGQRGQVWQKREELADSLTRERDGLHEQLAARARDRNLARDWPDLFFKAPVTHRKNTVQAPASTPSTPATGTASTTPPAPK